VDVSTDGSLYLITEYVSGETLSSRLKRDALGVGEAARLGQILAEALAAAHAKGVVHRDVKPQNVMLTSNAPGVKLLDFGISKTGDAIFESRLTEPGQILGTPAYMAPEQFKNPSGVTSACDVYSLGLLVYEAIAGRGPFEIDNALQAIAAHTLDDPPPLDELVPAAPKEMSDLIGSCLAKDPTLRPTAARVAEVLAHIGDELGAPDATELAPPASTLTAPSHRAGGT
jgi:serine/threonine-protein kinase